MNSVLNHIQHADWKTEKHVPVIECDDHVKTDELFTVDVAIGKEIRHPNTTEHHIKWISLYFKPDDEKFTYVVGNYEFSAHGESVQGANQGPVYAFHSISAAMRVEKPGTLYALAYCNIHGLWESNKHIEVF